jgi:hypothetical protein
MPSAPPAASASNETREYVRQREASTVTTSEYNPRKSHVYMLRRLAILARRALESSQYDASFERPDLIEDDYFRFRRQPRN